MCEQRGARRALGVALLSACAVVACTVDNSIGPDAVDAGNHVPGAGSGGDTGSAGTDVPVSGGAAGASDVAGGAAGASGSTGGRSGGAGTDAIPAIDSGVAGGGSTAGSAGAGGATHNDAGAGSDAAAGSAGAGGTAGGGGTGVIAAGGASKCPLAGALLCDGFEGAAPGASGSNWMVQAGMSSVTVDTTKPYRGSQSVHIKFVATSNSPGFITETASFATAANKNSMWGRLFVWYQLDGGQAAPAGHFVFIRAEGTPAAGQPAASAQLHVSGGRRGHLATEIRTNSDLYKESTIAVPQAQPGWQCWEWHTNANNTLEFYIDGKAIPELAVTAADKWVFPSMNKLYLGWLDFSAGPSGNMWIDEVAVSDTQIGCDR